MYGISPLSPAYGRDYTSKAAAQADLDAGKDFATPSGRYVNAADLRAAGVKTVQVRFGNLRKTAVLVVK
jgi:hypothetical protein